MALVTFVNDSAPYLNADNLNNNFTECNNIIDSGSNANGSYIKFSDGTLMQWGEATKTITSTTALASGGYRSAGFDFSFPIEFYNTSISVVAMSSGGGIGILLDSSSTTKAKFQASWWTSASNSTSRDGRISWQAIGRWKA